MTVPPDFGGRDIEEGLEEDLGVAREDHRAVSSQDEDSAMLSDNEAHAAGQVCARCGAVITPARMCDAGPMAGGCMRSAPCQGR